VARRDGEGLTRPGDDAEALEIVAREAGDGQPLKPIAPKTQAEFVHNPLDVTGLADTGIAVACVPAAAHLNEIAQGMARSAFESQGLAAFDSTRRAASLHEAGHTIIGTLDGRQVRDLTIRRRLVAGRHQWFGMTRWRGWDATKPLTSPDSTVADDIATARNVIAGWAAELLFDPDFRQGTSIDEVATFNIVVSNVIGKVGKSGSLKERKSVLDAILGGVFTDLRHNEGVVKAVANRLETIERLHGAELRGLLAKVRVANGGATMSTAISLDEVDQLTSGRLGTHDVPCPLCGPQKLSRSKQNKRVLRVWRIDPGFASYYCARCGVGGRTHDGSARVIDSEVVRRLRQEADERARATAAEKHRKAAWLWSQRRPITGSIAERYLRARGITCPLPATLGFLPASGKYPPAMIAAYAFPDEPEPGLLGAPRGVNSVHLTRLLPNGSDRERSDGAKITLGRPLGRPIVLAPPNDLLGLAITEGIEDALTAHQTTGLGAWAAGSAGSMPKVAAAVPDYIDCVTIYAHPEEAGQNGARELAEAIAVRGIEVRVEGLR
jgi:hypothetical protein